MKIKPIAVTGGIGSGKSEVLKILKENGYNVISCDDVTNEVYSMPKIKKKLIKSFNTAEKSEIKKVAFDEICYKKICEIITPTVFKLAYKRAKKTGKNTVIEVPLLFEGGYQKKFDKIIVVKRPLKDRIESVKKRSSLSENEIIDRVKRQIDYDKTDFSEYLVIENDDGLENLKKKVSNLTL